MTIFTIGHSRHTSGHFVALLHAHAIGRLVDVRSHPVSKWAMHFDKVVLEQTLAEHGIDYVFLGRELGGRPVGSAFYRADGSVDYVRRSTAPDFEAGIGRLVELSQDRRTTILCAEEDPTSCHRRLLVAPALRRSGAEVIHVRGDARLEPEGSDTPSPQLVLF